MGNPSLISIENLRFERDDTAVVSCDQLHVNVGEILQIEGPNGSGKTTLLRLLTTALQPQEGTILYCGKSIAECRFEYLSDIFIYWSSVGGKVDTYRRREFGLDG